VLVKKILELVMDSQHTKTNQGWPHICYSVYKSRISISLHLDREVFDSFVRNTEIYLFYFFNGEIM
jgi:hypothetical protein